jgi:hypothetical protein
MSGLYTIQFVGKSSRNIRLFREADTFPAVQDSSPMLESSRYMELFPEWEMHLALGDSV